MLNLQRAKQGLSHLSPADYFGKKRFEQLLRKDDKAAEQVLKSIHALGKPVFLVFGNSDSEWYKYLFDTRIHRAKREKRRFLRKLCNLRDITYGTTSFQGISFVGLGGYMDIDAYFDRKQFKDDTPEQYCRKKLRREKTRKHFFSLLRATKARSILVLHYPPKGVFDIIRDKKDNPMNGESSGIGFVRDAIKRYQPLLAFSGHMHEYQGMKRMGRTVVVNPGDAEKGKYAIVELDEKGKGRVRARFY